jgi:kynureninase
VCAPACARVRTCCGADPSQRGCQLSLLCDFDIMPVQHALEKEMVVVDIRKPSTFRVAPVPLYNTFSDVAEFARLFSDLVREHAV